MIIVIMVVIGKLSFASPIEQFETLKNYCCAVLVHNSFILTLFLSCVLMMLFFCIQLPIFVFFQRNLVFFFKNIFKNIIEFKNQEFFIYFFFIFIFILLHNLIGILPYTFTLTSSFLVTFFLSFITFFGILYINIEKNKLNAFSLFVPKGVPVFILPFLIIIEVISNFIRVISLSVRLFANMVAGHALIKILISFGAVILCSCNIFSIFGLAFWVLIIVIGVLEVMIAFLQAYVFTFLSLVYLSEIL